ncbi:succinate dehydrogenase assembly factor 2 [Nereida sp. MMG025]|uniref:FAD assembly factor SdhE n=1 Tax=Nereida sp. MMG025 TaxID=2909981 RepID=UPI001F298714|nr:succinate dehydrogenase assembly factor 2 [Nereida sp. MMG025]MCF6443887.1 succinate dehydrogenase assembly factor 2 [Nereida sp. MMG025]
MSDLPQIPQPQPPADEPRETRIKRLYMRSIRRGIKEMDVILMGYADAHLAGLSDDELTTYDALLAENDHDLYQWVTGQVVTPPEFLDMISDIAAHLKKT